MDSLTVILIVPNKETGRFSLVMFEEWKFAEKGYLPTAPSGFMDKSDKGSLLKAAERILQKELGFGLKDMPGHRWLEFNLGGRPRSAFSGSVEGSVGTRETTNTICASQYGVGIFAQSLPPVLEGKGAWLADLCPQGVDDLETRQITDRHSPVRLYAREAMIWLGQQGFIDWHGNPTEKAQWMFN
ncbi:MAG: hypothetical protein COY40_03240 [Alphaproteobacteria bacterium CG_4_10_14_0_8_um_filter_53_9]|nr:MAG: hypothetical protein COY40_03240 [Alphaproteobacteria bacterium CG_4_10_14_0_8_um_filter_53_9]